MLVLLLGWDFHQFIEVIIIQLLVIDERVLMACTFLYHIILSVIVSIKVQTISYKFSML